MNRSIIAFGLALGLLFTSPAFAAGTDTGAEAGVRASYQDIMNGRVELNKAIRTRQVRYLLELKRGHQDRLAQLAQHQFNLYRNNVDTTATTLKRSGEFNTIPQYAGRRHFSNPATTAPNTAKRNFRVRAIDYYVEAGDAGKEALEENVKLGSQHRVTRSYFNKQLGGQGGYADLVSSIRQLQKSNYAKSSTTSQFIPFSERTGALERNYLHPYMKFVE